MSTNENPIRCVRQALSLRVWIALAIVASVGVTLSITAPTAAAAVRQAFTPAVYSSAENGAIMLSGNTQMTCPSAKSGCSTAQTSAASTSSSNAAINNNSFVMGFIDADALATTTNSTSADLDLPAGSTVLYAYL